MKKTIAIVGVNLLIAGGLSARAGWMIMSGCNIDGTCRGSPDMLTWGLAIGPALILLVVLGLSVPKLLAGMSERREMKAEKAAVAASLVEEAEQGQSRLARLKRPAADEQTDVEAGDHLLADAGQDGALAEDRFVSEHDSNPSESFFSTASRQEDDADAIEREWQAAEAALDPARTGFMAEPTADGGVPAELPPTFATGPVAFSDLPPYQTTETEEQDFRLTPLTLDRADIEESKPEVAVTGEEPAAGNLDLTELADIGSDGDQPTIATFDPAIEADSDDDLAWRIEPAEPAGAVEAATPWTMSKEAQDDDMPPAGDPADIWARTAFDIGSDDDTAEIEENSVPVSRIDLLSFDGSDEELPPIGLPSMGRAPDEWSWLFADGLPLLRTARATGFPWIAGGIGEVATSIQTSVELEGIANFAAEAEAWVRIARSIPYAEALPAEDAQAFVEWCNSLSVDLTATDQQEVLCQAIAEAMYRLRGRARNDMETSLALPDAFDIANGGAFGRSLAG